MSGDEFLVTLISLVVGPVAWGRWFFLIAQLPESRAERLAVRTLAAVVVGCTVLLLVILATLSSPDVRTSVAYVGMYTCLGLAWLRVANQLFPYLGISPRDDAVERHNLAAVAAISGALVGATLCYAGGNIGSGPGWWVVVFCSALATGAFGGLWLLVDAVAGISDRVTIDRDPSAGMRVGGLLIALGAILGRAVAGDWTSVGATVADFIRVGWVAVPIALFAVLVERVLTPTPERPTRPAVVAGVVPGLSYCLAAGIWIVIVGGPT